MKAICLLAIIINLLLFTGVAYGQREASHWFFGDRCALNFSGGTAAASFEGAIRAIGGTAVVSDRLSGALLFYTDGRNFWNRDHALMENTHTLSSGCFTNISQPAIIIPSASENLYHVFCIRPQYELPPPDPANPSCTYATDRDRVTNGESGLNLYYFLVDLRLNNGLGNIVEDKSNILVATNITEKLTAVPHANGEDYWVVVHGWKTNTFYSYHFSEGEIVSSVSTHIGSVHGDYGDIYFEQELRGEMKTSPDGAKIACAVFDSDRPFDLFDFDAATGVVSNYVNLGDIRGQYGVSFSPDNSKLYVTSDSRAKNSSLPEIIVQFDLSARSAEDIVASRRSVVVANTQTNIPNNGIFDGWATTAKGMALAMDGQLYISGNEPRDQTLQNHILVTIAKPNETGTACDIRYAEFPFRNGETAIGLPNFLQSYFNGLKPIAECRQSSLINFFPNPLGSHIEISEVEGCAGDYLLEIVNALGQQVLPPAPVSAGERLALPAFADGVYFLIFHSQESRTVKRAIKLE